MKYVIDLNKVEDKDGVLTPKGMTVAEQYARSWVHEMKRDLNLERKYPELDGLFYDIRIDADLAMEHAS